MMKHFRIPHFLSLLVAGMCVAAPASSYADRKVKVYRDLDGDGHYNKKTYKVGGHHGHHGYYGGHRGYYGGSRYYGGYPRYGYGYGGYGYGGYGYSPYYSSYGYYPRSSIGVSLYSSPSYYSRERYSTYRSAPRSSYSYNDELSVEVQQALKRRGYYQGPIDGDIGPGSRSAIRAYQADRGLSVNGRIDSSLLRALGIG